MQATSYAVLRSLIETETYPEREERRLGTLDRAWERASGMVAPFIRPRLSRFEWIAKGVAAHSPAMAELGDDEILPLARSIGRQLRKEGYTDDLVGRAFALIREVAGRKLGMRHFDVQLIGGLVLLKGMIAEMETGEGKTLTATLAAGTAALSGTAVHVVTVNDYLAERDAEWMSPVYGALGLTVGVIKQGMDLDSRRSAYGCDITYCTNKELAFDYLKDRILLWDHPGPVRLQLERIYNDDSRAKHLLLRGLQFAIVDEADSVLIDEARTPLIISAEAKDFTEQAVYQEAFDVARQLVQERDFTVSVEGRLVLLTDAGKIRIEDFPWQEARGWTAAQQRQELVRQALSALHLFVLDKHYLVRDGKVQIIDEYTGRVMPDRSWERGLHQLIEIKETCEMTPRKDTRARISYQRFFRRYRRLAGMTGTAREVVGELCSIYHLRVVSVATNRPCQRKYLPDRLYPGEQQKWEAVVESIAELNGAGRPVLVGTRSVGASEHLSEMLTQRGLPHRVLNARQDQEEAEIVAQAGQEAAITVATNMAGRGTDIHLGTGVADSGGLHVLATERNEARRIDRQLFGRSARQGDPGTCEVFVSLQDELIESYGSRIVLRLLPVVLGNPKRSRAATWLGALLFNMAQRRVERRHARMRRNLLKMDEQMGDVLAFSGRQE